MANLSSLDKALLNMMQSNFPLNMYPYKTMADKLGVTEEEIIARIEALKEAGIIRRIGAVLDARRLGFFSTLCAAKVSGDKINEVAEIINKYDGVTHNYRRTHEYNLWFTLTAPSQEESRIIIDELMEKTGVHIVSMPAIKSYKIKVALEMEGDGHHK